MDMVIKKDSQYWKTYWKNYFLRKYSNTLPDRTKLIMRCNSFARNNRDKIMFRDGYKCVECKSDKNLVLHHLKYVNDFKYIITLCEKCHKEKHGIKPRRYDIPLSEIDKLRLSREIKTGFPHSMTTAEPITKSLFGKVRKFTPEEIAYKKHKLKRGTMRPSLKKDIIIRTPKGNIIETMMEEVIPKKVIEKKQTQKEIFAQMDKDMQKWESEGWK